MVLPTSPQGERMQSEVSIALLEACIYLLNHKRLLRVLGLLVVSVGIKTIFG